MPTLKVTNTRQKKENPVATCGYVFSPQETVVVTVNSRDHFRLRTKKALEVEEVTKKEARKLKKKREKDYDENA